MEVLKRLQSQDGSVKFLLRLRDNKTVETLYMHDKSCSLTYNSTVCVSSQVGCKIGCRFCATGKQGFHRNLNPGEIVKQVEQCNTFCVQSGKTPIRAVVFAGMGEPLLNYENVRSAIYILYHEYGIYHFELATVGIVPAIYELIRDFKDSGIMIRLNLSLHASTDDARESLIPMNAKYNIPSILDAAFQYARLMKTKVRIRYMLIDGVNDTELDVIRLIRLLENKPAKFILSSYNDNCIEGLTPSGSDKIQIFYDRMKDRIESDIFFNFGSDIRGGCGQLQQIQQKEFLPF